MFHCISADEENTSVLTVSGISCICPPLSWDACADTILTVGF